jgi:hypothetical protein
MRPKHGGPFADRRVNGNLRWWWPLTCAVILGATGAGCSALLGADPTPEPGAAATLTRSLRTPIPTPMRTPDASPGASAVPSRVAVGGSLSPVPVGTSQAVDEADVAQVQRRMEQAVASPALPGVEGLLLDHVSLSTAQGGSVMDNGHAAAWLRDHAGPGIKVTQMERDTQTLVLQVLTDGWPTKDPVQLGHVSFSLRRYGATGRPDEEVGDWKIDVIEAE